MQEIVSVENMRLSDQATILGGCSSQELMSRAGRILLASLPSKDRVVIFVGSGNNGGDGFALASHLLDLGYQPKILTLSDKFSDDETYYASLAKEKGALILPYCPHQGQVEEASVLVDCLFGTGFNPLKEMPPLYQEAIKEINSYPDKYVISCDINSGVNGNTGAGNLYVKSSLTVCLQAIKKGTLLSFAKCCSSLLVGDIGIKLSQEEDQLLTASEFARFAYLPKLYLGDLTYVQLNGHRYYLKPESMVLQYLSYK